jgi:hypothetical protein
MRVEDLTELELLTDLRSIPLPREKREWVLKCDRARRAGGGLPVDVVIKLRRMWEAHRQRIDQVREARERAHSTMGRQNQGMTEKDLDAAVARRKAASKRKKHDPNDLGF